MLHGIIGAIVSVVMWFVIYKYGKTLFRTKSEARIMSLCCGLYCGVVVSVFSILICMWLVDNNVHYETMPAVVSELGKGVGDRYFALSIDGSSVSVLVLNEDGTYQKETYDEKKTTFQEGEKAEISVVKETMNWSKEKSFWYAYEPEQTEKVKEVTITIPKDSYTIKDLNVQSEMESIR